jgi:hypothetical protein
MFVAQTNIAVQMVWKNVTEAISQIPEWLAQRNPVDRVLWYTAGDVPICHLFCPPLSSETTTISRID